MEKVGMYYNSPLGLVWIEEERGCISALRFVNERVVAEKTSALLKNAYNQVDEYFHGQRKNFDLPLFQSGTDFQKKAWSYLQRIPYGETVAYKDEAIALGDAKACRAVGSANGKNNIAIIIPCHRVLSSDGSLGGYAYGVDVKKALLELEQKYK